MIGNTPYGATAGALRPFVRPRRAAHRCPARPGAAHQRQRSSGAGPRPRSSGTPRTDPLTIGPAGVTSEITAIGKDIYNNGSVTRGVYSLQANVEPGNSGGPLIGPGGEVIGVVFSRSTVYPDVGYALTSPGVLARVQEAALHRGSVSTGPCIAG